VSVGLLLITHAGIGAELLAAATRMLGACPLRAKALAVGNADDPESVGKRARAYARDLDAGDGVLVLTDLFGSTPSNIASRLGDTGRPRIRILSGVNLPMLVRVLNYPQLPLDAMVDKAVSGAREGVLICHASECAVEPDAARRSRLDPLGRSLTGGDGRR
jgi:PTS system ascorbate-specific IIA component